MTAYEQKGFILETLKKEIEKTNFGTVKMENAFVFLP